MVQRTVSHYTYFTVYYFFNVYFRLIRSYSAGLVLVQNILIQC